MPKDMESALTLDDLSQADLDRLEARLFCAGGPPDHIEPEMLDRCRRARAPKPTRITTEIL